MCIRDRLYLVQSQGVAAPIGTIFTDSIYTPVYNVNYTVENTRVGSNTDYDRLTFEVLTNGVILAKEAISLGAKILNEHLNLFVDLSDEAKNAEIMVEREDTIKEKVLEMTIEELDMSVRSFNCLKRAGIEMCIRDRGYPPRRQDVRIHGSSVQLRSPESA